MTENKRPKKQKQPEIRYDENPFLKDLIVPIGTKSVAISQLGKDDNILVNQTTGEINGTHIVARKKVDADQFIKMFSNYLAYTFELTRAGNKATKVLMWAMKSKIDADLVLLDKYCLEDFLEEHKNLEPPLKLSMPTFMRGLNELAKAKLIAKAQRRGWYYINPSCVFNGSRVAFTTLLEKAEKVEKEKVVNDQQAEKKTDAEDQMSLLENN